MRSEHLLISLLGLLLGFFMIFGGVLVFFAPHLSFSLISHFNYVGVALFVVGVLFLAICFGLNRRRYLLLKMGGVSVEDRLIAHFAKTSLQKLFPQQSVECDVLIKGKGRVEIMANIPYVSEKKQNVTFEQIETALSATLREQCQFKREFIFNVGFLQPSRKQNNS